MKILLVDDHTLFREGMVSLLHKLDPQAAIVGVGQAEQAHTLLDEGMRPDLLLLDLELGGESGSAVLRELRARHPALPVVVVSGHDEPEVILAAINDGAMGFVPKSASSDVMIAALRLILAGGIYLPCEALALGPVAAPLRSGKPGELGLSPRQTEVLHRVLKGMSNKQICRELDISPATVKSHISAILRVLNVTTRTQAVIAASRLGLRFEA
ncbi:response regulator [Chitinimonas koreensis]|uniref:response regulator n=1 Tax=Chitinimonas koreensis TaxID=356302 RepID=UPI00041955F5|nr:response regulator transcription factor [Chitinimonas koreensis]QNM95364.1 response regulator transcription factor [Chitinimonas koreensis]